MTRRRAVSALAAAVVVLVAGRALGAERNVVEDDYDAITTQTLHPPVVITLRPSGPRSVPGR